MIDSFIKNEGDRRIMFSELLMKISKLDLLKQTNIILECKKNMN